MNCAINQIKVSADEQFAICLRGEREDRTRVSGLVNGHRHRAERAIEDDRSFVVLDRHHGCARSAEDDTRSWIAQSDPKCFVPFHQSIVEDRNRDRLDGFQRAKSQRATLRRIIQPGGRSAVAGCIVDGECSAAFPCPLHGDNDCATGLTYAVTCGGELRSNRIAVVLIEPGNAISAESIDPVKVAANENSAV